MAGNVLGKGYTAGVGMTIGTAFGRIAGRECGQSSRERWQAWQALEALASDAPWPCLNSQGRLKPRPARQMQICNACRYCEGFCAVFPAMTRRLEFSAADLHFLANLCHNCGACLHACQYAPPHEFAVNVPQGHGASARRNLQPFTRGRRRFGGRVPAATASCWRWRWPSALRCSSLLAVALKRQGSLWAVPNAPAASTTIFPHGLMVSLFGPVFAVRAAGARLSARVPLLARRDPRHGAANP